MKAIARLPVSHAHTRDTAVTIIRSGDIIVIISHCHSHEEAERGRLSHRHNSKPVTGSIKLWRLEKNRPFPSK
jgi:hypothetical protein